MELFLGIRNVSEIESISSGQLLTPDLRFTCDGVVTKWIIGADWNSNKSLFPELQVWRNTGNSTYQKISGVSMELPASSTRRIYIYVDFPPVKIQAGDILGVFMSNKSRLSFLYETNSSVTNYIVPIGDSELPSLDTFDLEQNASTVVTGFYRLLVSAKVGKLLNN